MQRGKNTLSFNWKSETFLFKFSQNIHFSAETNLWKILSQKEKRKKVVQESYKQLEKAAVA